MELSENKVLCDFGISADERQAPKSQSASRLYFQLKAVGMQVADAIRAFLQSAEEATHKDESAELPFVRLGTADVNKESEQVCYSGY